jgi:hypothetical protein
MFRDGAHDPVCGRVSSLERNIIRAKACWDTLHQVRFEAEYIGQKGDGYGPPQLAVIIMLVPFPFPDDCQK